MKKLFKVLFLAVALFVMNGMAQAQVKIAIVNSAEVMDAMPESAAAQKALEKYANELQAQLQAMGTEYQNKVQDYQANEATMSNLVRQSKEKEILDLQNRIQQFQANAQTELANKELELLNPIIEKIQKAINEIGKERGFTYVIDKAASGVIVYVGDDAVDITKDVKTKVGVK